MASTFSLTSGSYDGRYLQLSCSQSKDIATNKSTISWTLSSIGGSSNYYSVGPTTVIVNGVQVYYKQRLNWDSKTFPAAKGSASGTIVVDHNSNGSKSISVSMSTAIYTGTVSSYSGTWKLDDIPRQATITSAPNFTDLDNPTIYFSNPAGNAVEKLQACIDFDSRISVAAYRDINKTNGTYTFPLTDAERNNIRENTVTSRKIGFHLWTRIGGVDFYSSVYKTVTLAESDATRPTVSMEVTLNNGSLPSTFDGLYIQGKSRLNIAFSAYAKYGATISSYYVDVGGKRYNHPSFTNDAITTDVITASGKVDVSGCATDSRGFPGYYTGDQINVIPYSKPLVVPIGSDNAILCYRSDGNGVRVGNSTSVWIKAKRSFYSVDWKNSCALQWRKKLITEGWNDQLHPWNDLIGKSDASTDEYNALLSGEVFDKKKSYTVQIRAIDDIGEYDLKTFEIPTEDVALHLGAGGKNVSVGSYCDYSEDHTFHSEWKAIFDKDVLVGGNILIGENKTNLRDYILSIMNGG